LILIQSSHFFRPIIEPELYSQKNFKFTTRTSKGPFHENPLSKFEEKNLRLDMIPHVGPI